MANQTGELRGVVRGKMIELEEETGLPDGAAVTVRLQEGGGALTEDEKLERFRRAAGAWAGDDEEGLDEYLRWNYEQRTISRPEIEE